MKVAIIQFSTWDKEYYFGLNDLNLKKGDAVIVKTNLGLELGTIANFTEVSDKEYVLAKDAEADVPENEQGKVRTIKPIIRKADNRDLDKIPDANEKQKAIKYFVERKEASNLPMKVIDAHFSYDGARLTFAFIADGRIDFRELVKDLTRHFNKTVRLHQIGIRDEAKICGDCGHCGRILCCRTHLHELSSITSEMADLQQCAHRGSDRVSGICGRLMCCLAYEQKGYQELAQNLPPLGERIQTDSGPGVVCGHHTLKQSVKVDIRREKGDDRTIIEVPIKKKK